MFMICSRFLSHRLRAVVLAGLTLICWLGLTWGAGVPAAQLPRELQTLDQQLQELQTLVQRQDLPEISPYIRSRFRLLRKQLFFLSQDLPQPEQKQALQVSRRIANQLVKLDQSAKGEKPAEVAIAYRDLVRAVDEFETFYP